MASNKLLPSYLFKSQIGAQKTFEIETLTSYQSWEGGGLIRGDLFSYLE